MRKTDSYKEKKQWIGISFAIGAALGSLYGALILGPVMDSVIDGTIIGIAIGTGAGVSLGAFYEVETCPEKMNKKESKLLIAVIIATFLLVLSTAFMAYSEIA